ncbi:luciferase family protein [Mycobacteroides abscessus]|nr:luciferase family protein [Mycobacteroides abscessus]CPX14518.1 luciferase family protein [Mycobacteroides abscessus]CPZ99477.1 luciferase family protein [Mycobacteroides abscessus]
MASGNRSRPWGGIERSPAESLGALDEAIQIMQQTWATDAPGPVLMDGTYYKIIGSSRGPAPLHKINIWVGGYKPRMLDLIGRRADGWLPSLSYLPGGAEDLTHLNRLIDNAATAANRRPTDIRRILNLDGHFSSRRQGFLHGTPRSWAQDLAELSSHYGISGFIFATDDPSTIQRIATEVVPETRQLLA